MTTSIIESGKVLKCDCCKAKTKKTKVNQDGTNISETINPYSENMTIIMEFYKYFGKEFNIISAFEEFKKVNKNVVKGDGEKYTEADLRNMYIVALQNLKYMGYFSATR